MDYFMEQYIGLIRNGYLSIISKRVLPKWAKITVLVVLSFFMFTFSIGLAIVGIMMLSVTILGGIALIIVGVGMGTWMTLSYLKMNKLIK